MTSFQELIIKIVARLRLFPHILFTAQPFKVLEFAEILKGGSFSRDDVVLDIGSGFGIQTLLIGKRVKRVIGIDPEENMVRVADRFLEYVGPRFHTEFRATTLEEARFESDYFDKIYSICVIEHIPNYLEALRESYRVLKKGGTMIFSVDALETIEDQRLIQKHAKDHSVYRYFRKDDLKAVLEDIGFLNVVVYPIFTSQYATRLYERGINCQFKYGCLSFVPNLVRLWMSEKTSRRKTRGIFLVARCNK